MWHRQVTNNSFGAWNRIWSSSTDGSGSGLDADLLDGKDHTNFGATLAAYGTTAGASGRVRCTAPFNTNSAKMFKITVSLYHSYGQHDYVIGGYMYPSTNQWYAPTCIYTGNGNPDIIVGRDSNGKAYISIANGNYAGVRVHSMTRGYQTSVADTYDPWTITINAGTENSVTPTVSKVWHSTNDGSGSGLDADLLDGQQGSYYLPTTGKAADSDLLDGANAAESGASTIHKLASNGYSQLNNWTSVGGTGLYSGTTNGAHWYPNTATSYGTWRIDGSRGGYTGIYLHNGGAVVIGMYDSAGNGGDYHQASGKWSHYWHRGNTCLAINGSTTSSSYALYSNGAIYSTNNIVAYSDRRVKENIVQIDGALEKVNKLTGVYYNKIDDEKKNKEIGFIAQDVNEVVPELVSYAEDVDQYGVKYGNTTALLVEAIKELTQQVKDLQQELKELK